ncbi:MAG: NAD-binding protein [Bacteroidales bacterium]|nr:NAD-binding protein [Bacteroidales bacterium]
MKLLVYGAGVIGCELAHVLKRGGNDVTLLARGEWKDTLEKRGLVIRYVVFIGNNPWAAKTEKLSRQVLLSKKRLLLAL